MNTRQERIDVQIDRPILGVPITFLDKYDPSSTLPSYTIIKHNLGKEFDIIGQAHVGADSDFDLFRPSANGKQKFSRILIRAKKGVKV